MTSGNGARVDEERIKVTKYWMRLLEMVATDPLGDALGQGRKEGGYTTKLLDIRGM
jgi:hypothetical protein